MQLELQYRQDYAAITGTIGLTQSPIVEATGVVGSDGFAFGGELGFDSTSGNLTKYNAGLSFLTHFWSDLGTTYFVRPISYLGRMQICLPSDLVP
jgi:hypothetical protein